MPQMTTGAFLGQYLKDLIEAGIPADLAYQAVSMAAHEMAKSGGLAVTEVAK